MDHCSGYLKNKSVQSLSVNWRKALRSLWKLSPRTHSNIITAFSKNMPLIVNLEKRFIVKNLSCSNPLVSIISKIALSNPMSDTGYIGFNHNEILTFIMNICTN